MKCTAIYSSSVFKNTMFLFSIFTWIPILVIRTAVHMNEEISVLKIYYFINAFP